MLISSADVLGTPYELLLQETSLMTNEYLIGYDDRLRAVFPYSLTGSLARHASAWKLEEVVARSTIPSDKSDQNEGLI